MEKCIPLSGFVDRVKALMPNTGVSDEEISKQIRADKNRVDRQFPGVLPEGALKPYEEALIYGAAASLAMRINDHQARSRLESAYTAELFALRDAISQNSAARTALLSTSPPPPPSTFGKSLPEAIEDGDIETPDEINELYAAMDEAIKVEDEIRKINAAIAAHGYGYCWAWVDADDLLKGVWLCPPLEMGYNPKIVPYNGAEQEKHLSEHWDQAVPDYCRDEKLALALFKDGRRIFGDAFLSAYNDENENGTIIDPDLFAAGFKGGLDQFPYPLPEAVARAFVSALGKEQEKEEESRREAEKIRAAFAEKKEAEARSRPVVGNRPSSPGSFNIDKLEDAREKAKRLWQFAQEAAMIPEPPPAAIKPGTLMMLDKDGKCVPAVGDKPQIIGILVGMDHSGNLLVNGNTQGPVSDQTLKVYPSGKMRWEDNAKIAIDRKVPARKPQTPYRILGKTQLDYTCPNCENGRLRYTEDPYTMGLKYVCDGPGCGNKGCFTWEEIERERLRQDKSDNKK